MIYKSAGIGLAGGTLLGGAKTYLDNNDANIGDYAKGIGGGALLGAGVGSATGYGHNNLKQYYMRKPKLASKPINIPSPPITTKKPLNDSYGIEDQIADKLGVTYDQKMKAVQLFKNPAVNIGEHLADGIDTSQAKIILNNLGAYAGHITDALGNNMHHITNNLHDIQNLVPYEQLHNAMPMIHGLQSMSPFSYMDETANFGLLDRFRGNDKKETAKIILSETGGLVGGAIGKVSGNAGKKLGIQIGNYIGARTATDTTALVRAIKNSREIPEFNNLNISQKIKAVTSQAKNNAIAYSGEALESSLNSLEKADTAKVYKPFRQAALDAITRNLDNFFSYKKTNIKYFNN